MSIERNIILIDSSIADLTLLEEILTKGADFAFQKPLNENEGLKVLRPCWRWSEVETLKCWRSYEK